MKRKYSRLKKTIITLLALLIIFTGYVEIINRNSKRMTYRQKVLKIVYPLSMFWANLKGKNNLSLSSNNAEAPVSFYTLKDTIINGKEFDLASLKGKKILLVNTASDCGYTNQYTGLEKLYRQYNAKLIVLGFPSNDFKQQEKESNVSIAQFCKENFDVSFPLMQKNSVLKQPGQNKVFEWLTDPAKNGWNSQAPTWNFCKYLVDENGRLVNYWGSAVAPFDTKIIEALDK